MPEKSTSAVAASLLSACGELVRTQDSDRFLCALMAPVAQRERLFTLLAFNQEIAKVRQIVSEPILGQMRLQWWREAVEAMAAGKPAPAHAVGKPLGDLINAEPALVPLLLELIEARERDLDDTPFESVAALAAYARQTSAPLLKALGQDAPEIAAGYALVGILRAIPAEAAAGRCRLNPEQLKEQVSEVSALAKQQLAGKAKGQARFWQAIARLYIKQLAKSGDEVGAPMFQMPHPWRGVTLLWALLTS